jgi:hypothetical protein
VSVIGNETVKLRALDIIEYVCGRPSLLRQMSRMPIYVKDFVLRHVDMS